MRAILATAAEGALGIPIVRAGARADHDDFAAKGAGTWSWGPPSHWRPPRSWRTIYLSKLPRLEKKVRVALNWTLDLFFSKDLIHYSAARACGVPGNWGYFSFGHKYPLKAEVGLRVAREPGFWGARRWAGQVRKCVVLHGIAGAADGIAGSSGFGPVVSEFLAQSSFRVQERLANSHGLVVLEAVAAPNGSCNTGRMRRHR